VESRCKSASNFGPWREQVLAHRQHSRLLSCDTQELARLARYFGCRSRICARTECELEFRFVCIKYHFLILSVSENEKNHLNAESKLSCTPARIATQFAGILCVFRRGIRTPFSG
jgi:hypothetical protein